VTIFSRATEKLSIVGVGAILKSPIEFVPTEVVAQPVSKIRKIPSSKDTFFISQLHNHLTWALFLARANYVSIVANQDGLVNHVDSP
jgi:hypothetical protein